MSDDVEPLPLLPSPAPASLARRLTFLALPWAFVLVYAVLYLGLVVPRMLVAHGLAVVGGGLAAVVFCTFLLAAITFSRDVLAGRWPE